MIVVAMGKIKKEQQGSDTSDLNFYFLVGNVESLFSLIPPTSKSREFEGILWLTSKVVADTWRTVMDPVFAFFFQ